MATTPTEQTEQQKQQQQLLKSALDTLFTVVEFKTCFEKRKKYKEKKK